MEDWKTITIAALLVIIILVLIAKKLKKMKIRSLFGYPPQP